MLVLRTKEELKTYKQTICNKRVSIIPTMGALHQGHLSLVKQSLKDNFHTIVSIFLNPLQFSPTEDFNTYPKNEKEDILLLKSLKVAAVFIPSLKEMYGVTPIQTYVTNSYFNHLYCGVTRKNFFNGILTIVIKLFHLVLPMVAYFGKKDYQQLFLIQKMVKELDLNIEIKGIETVREKTGLAFSSRNNYLSELEKEKASILYQSLLKTKRFLIENSQLNKSNTYNVSFIKDYFKRILLKEPLIKLEYIHLVSKKDFIEVKDLNNLEDIVILVAIQFANKVRLIDNIEMK